MKIFLSIIIVTLMSVSVNGYSQKHFEGVITYNIEYNDLPEEMKGFETMLPQETVMKIKGENTRTEQNTGMGSTVSIFSGDLGSTTTLMNMMGQKVAIKGGEKEAAEKQEELNIVYHDESKDIAGYKCKKATITIQGEPIVIYYTEEINTKQVSSQYKGLKGFPMEYEVNNQGINMTMVVKEVKKEKISDSEFSIPDDYQLMTVEEFQKQMSGQMGGE